MGLLLVLFTAVMDWVHGDHSSYVGLLTLFGAWLHIMDPHAHTNCIFCHKPYQWQVTGREFFEQCHDDRKHSIWASPASPVISSGRHNSL